MPCVLSRRKYRQVNPILVATVILPLITAKGAELTKKRAVLWQPLAHEARFLS